jgi:hypothetical protein
MKCGAKSILVTFTMLITMGSAVAQTSDCGTGPECYARASAILNRATLRINDLEARLKTAEDNLRSLSSAHLALVDSIRHPHESEPVFCKREAGSANPPGCTAKCQPDEILIGGSCGVPGKGEYSTGYVQNIGSFSPTTRDCQMVDVAGHPPLGALQATALCIKIPR